MSVEFNVQCQSCGTIYNDLQDVCPYCGEPQPGPSSALPAEQVVVELPPQAQPFIEEWAEEPSEELPPEAEADDEEVFPKAEPPDLAVYLSPRSYLAEEGRFARGGLEVTDEAGFYPDDPAYTSSLEPYLEESYDEDYFPQQEVLAPAYYENDAYGAAAEVEPALQPAPTRFTWFRLFMGCLGMFLCVGLIYGTIGLLAVRAGLQERAVIIQTTSEEHYQKGREHLTNDSIDLAVAEFEMALSINPNFPSARQALREAQRIAQARPTPTSEARSAAAAEIFDKGEALVEEEQWDEAIQTLLQVRDLDPQYQALTVSRWLYEANYTLGLQLLSPEQVGEALTAFESALVERPDDAKAQTEQARAALYLEGVTAEVEDWEKSVEIFAELYEEDSAYLDVEQRLVQAYEALGDELFEAEEWCLAETHYTEASILESGTALRAKAADATERCQDAPLAQQNGAATARPRPGGASAGAAAKATPGAANLNTQAQAETETTSVKATPSKATSNGQGAIFFSAYNLQDERWEILAVPASGGRPELVVPDAVMPAVSPNGQILLYHSELGSAEGLHALNMVTGENVRITTVRDNVLPHWGGDNLTFLFVSREGATGRWLVQQNFADGKSNSIILQDGRTPDWSPDGKTIAYQGTDPQGNNPGIYTTPFGGGETVRLTNHESDRSPSFSPDSSQVAYMSTRDGNWNIYTVSTRGSAPQQITTHAGNDGLPVWSPDGSQLAYVSDMGGSWAIYIINAAGGAPVKVTEWDGSRHPDWLLAQIDWR
jgi:tetratricopeptide (TPR) repeat protein